MEQLKMHSLDKIAENVEKIATLFPNCITESADEYGGLKRAIDFDMLKQELSDYVVEGLQERYQFTWPDKKKAMLAANAPINKTLRPCREESVDFDNTGNLYIEGDNLEVLKLLQETYLGKVKMIYIDPPYNTGNDFVYNDDFAQDAEEYMANSGQYNEEGNRLVTNTESNGRFHTDWLNMMYPRLKLAKDLLSDDGVIFISIDEHEKDNLKKITSEIFGEINLIGVISNTNNPKGRSDDKYIATAHEYILVYAKKILGVDWNGFEPTTEIIKRYNKTDLDDRRYREIDLRKTGENDLREDRPNLFYYFYYNKNNGDFFPDKNNKNLDDYIKIKPLREDGKEGNWRWGLLSAKEKINELIPKYMPNRKIWGVMQKDYLDNRALVKPTSSWSFKDVNSERGTEEFVGLGFDKRVFLKPKPVGTIHRCIQLCMKNSGGIILDFFSGSATTAHAVMKLNEEDGGHRKFIMVQLPEACDEKSEAYKAGYKNICEIGKERIRRAGQKIKDDNPLTTQDLDVGFRVLKLDSSNMEDIYYTPKEYMEKEISLFVDNVKADRSSEDLLFQVMLDLGTSLSSKIVKKEIAGKEVFDVANGHIMACFDKDVNDDVITAIAKEKPSYFVMRDNSLADDRVAINFDQIFNTYSPNTERKVL